jgi:formate hydrogenlyase subunit 4
MTHTAIIIIQPILALLLAPLLPGITNRVKAFFAGRRGQPVLQTYYDIYKLLHKGAVYSSTTSLIFRIAPVICLSAVLTTALLIPLGGQAAPLSFQGDLILLAYLLGLVRFFIVIGALDTGSAFEGMGASREVQFSALCEPALFIALAAIARQTSCLSLSEMFASITPAVWSANSATVLLAVSALLIVLLAENARIPVDDPNTHLELTMIHEVMVLDNSGPDFAFVLYTSSLKLWVLGAILIGILLPVFELAPWVNIGLSVLGLFVLAVVVGIIESCMARLRLIHVPRLLLTASALAVLSLVFAVRR